MTETVFGFALASLLAAFILAFVPTRHLHPGIAIISSIALLYLAPISLAWSVVLTVASWAIMQTLRARFGYVAIFLAVCVIGLLVLREQSWLTALGAAYFTLRIMHVLLEWWMERLKPVNFLPLLSYMLFLPTFLAGPIHRYPNFDRQVARRRVSAESVFRGLERVLIGLFSVVFLSGWIVQGAQQSMSGASDHIGGFAFDWVMSAWGWIELYFAFAGLSGIAIGCALISGIVIEENFNHPYKSRSLTEFWSRWHMSLTSWCRDYVFSPVSVSLRSPALGVFAAMLVLGLWHESSAYYVLWSFWQAAGIVFSQVARPVFARLPDVIDRIIAPIMILGWLSLAKPVVNRVLEVMP